MIKDRVKKLVKSDRASISPCQFDTSPYFHTECVTKIKVRRYAWN